MEKRVQRYTKEVEEPKKSRTSKNRYLYDQINSKIGYEEITNLDTQTRIDLSELTGVKTSREEYQKTKDYQELFERKESIVEKEIKEEKDKIYDINSILEEARKNRDKYDELERKRKLKENDYATLADINNKDRYKKEENNNNIDEKELTDLINTITSHNLLKDIQDAAEQDDDGDLFSELMATNADISLEGIADEYTSQKGDSEEDTENKLDDSFYTKSMDLSNQDFEFSEELEAERKTRIKVLIAFLIILILAIAGVVAYLILKKEKII